MHAIDRFRQRWAPGLSTDEARDLLLASTSSAMPARRRSDCGDPTAKVDVEGYGQVRVIVKPDRSIAERGKSLVAVTVLPPHEQEDLEAILRAISEEEGHLLRVTPDEQGAFELMTKVSNVLAHHQIAGVREVDVQRKILQILRTLGGSVERERTLDPNNRIDFVVSKGGHVVGVEVKTAGDVAGVTMQLARYAAFDEIHGLVLATTRPALLDMPKDIEGKPLRTVLLRGGF